MRVRPGPPNPGLVDRRRQGLHRRRSPTAGHPIARPGQPQQRHHGAGRCPRPGRAGRYAVVRRGSQDLRLLLAKNPAGWAGMASMLSQPRPLLVIINAREADGRDTSWLWDVAFEQFTCHHVVASGERAADLGVRLSYAGLNHQTVPDPLAALAALPPGEIDVVANYTAFHQFRRRLSRERTATR